MSTTSTAVSLDSSCPGAAGREDRIVSKLRTSEEDLTEGEREGANEGDATESVVCESRTWICA
eukprot:1415243-Rhodomonas_salina.1